MLLQPRKKYPPNYAISDEIKVFNGYIGCYYDSFSYKKDVLLTLHDKDDPEEIILRSVYYISYNDDPRNRITVCKKCGTHTTKYQYIKELRRFDLREWQKHVYYPFEKMLQI